MSFWEAQPGDRVTSEGVIVRTCENGSKMYIGIGNRLAGMFEEDHEAIFAELEAELEMPLPAGYVPSGTEWWD